MPLMSGPDNRPAWTDADLQANPHTNADKARRVQKMFAAIAHRYDLNNRLHSAWQDQAWRRRVVAYAEVTSEDRVLDMACGTGDLTLLLAACQPASTLGMDFTEEMLVHAREKATQWGARTGHATPEFRQGDAMQIELPDGSIDLVTIAFGIRNVTDPAVAIGEFTRILAPGGRLLILEFSEPANRVIRAFNTLYTKHLMPWTATWISGDRTGAYKYLPKSISTFAQPAELAQMMQGAGLMQISQKQLTGGMCTISMATKH